MFKKKTLFFLGLGYLGGIAVALKYHKKTSQSFREELAKTDKKCSVFWKHVVQIHKDLFIETKDMILSPENMERLKEYKEKLLVHVEEFRQDAQGKIESLKEKWHIKKEEIEQELTKLYDRRLELLDQGKTKGSELLADVAEYGKKHYEEVKTKLAEVFEEIKSSLKK